MSEEGKTAYPRYKILYDVVDFGSVFEHYSFARCSDSATGVGSEAPGWYVKPGRQR